jgi:outer membrane lipoprotein-sorting protein
VSYLRRASTRSLIVVIVAVCALAAGGAAIAVAAAGSGPTPPPKPLDQAIADALAANPPAGVTADIQFTNNLFPSGALLGQTASALMTGASGRLWLTNDGRGRIELQSEAGDGDVQIVWDQQTISVYDASSNTVYRASLPQATASSTDTGTPPTLAEIDSFLTNLGVDWALSDAQPTNVGGQPAYSVSVSPKHDGGLLGSLQLAWDASQGTPLSVGIYAQGDSQPVLELALSNVSYGAGVDSAVSITAPADAKVVDLGGGAPDSGSSTPAVTGLAAVQAAAPFTVVAPDSLVGLPRQDVRLVGGDTVVALYGQGLGGIALAERQVDSSTTGSNDVLSNLPTVSLDGLTAHELATQLGTVLEWQSGSVSYVLAGSLPAGAAETAARDVK